MELALGIIIGLVIAVLIMVTLLYFRKPIEQKIGIVEKQVGAVAARGKGFIVEPSSDAEEFRAGVIEKNRKQGKDTRYEELL